MSFIDIPDRDIIEQAEDFIYRTLEPKDAVDLKLDGQKHRIALKGDKKGESSGEYRFYTDGCPAGYVRDFRNDNYQPWKFDFQVYKDSQPQIYQQSQTREFKEHARAIEEKRKKNEGKELAALTKEIKAKFDKAAQATDEHPYLKAKGIKNDGTLKINQAGELLIGLYYVDGKFKTYQRIFMDEDAGKFSKRFESGGVKRGAFHIIGGGELKHGDIIILAEGYATAYSIYAAIGGIAKVVMAVDCHNLFPVAEAIKAKFRPKCLLIAGDDDSRKHTDGTNPGKDEAKKCVEAGVADGYVLPPFNDFDEGGTDFNDFAAMGHDKEEIAAVISAALEKYTPRPWILSDEELTSQFKPTEWLIEDWLPEQSQIQLFGVSGAGKSFITLDMAASIACDDITDWYGLNIEHGDVLYLCGEGHNGLTKRLIGWKQAHGVTRPTKLHISQWPKNISDSSVTDQIINDIKALYLQNLKLIIVDTLTRHFGGNENDASDASNFLNHLAEIQREFKCAVLIVHHPGVSSEAKNRGRGSSAFKGAMDMELQVESQGEGANFYITLSQTKNKDDELKEPLTFKRNSIPVDGVFDKNGKQVFTAYLTRVDAPASKSASAQLKIKPAQKRALEAYIRAAQKDNVFTADGETFYGVRAEPWREEVYKYSGGDNDDSKERAFRRARQGLIEDLKILFSEGSGDNVNAYIYRPAARFKEYIDAAGLTSEFEQIRLTSKSETV